MKSPTHLKQRLAAVGHQPSEGYFQTYDRSFVSETIDAVIGKSGKSDLDRAKEVSQGIERDSKHFATYTLRKIGLVK